MLSGEEKGGNFVVKLISSCFEACLGSFGLRGRAKGSEPWQGER